MQRKFFWLFLFLILSNGCASIPAEAPELSAQLGARLSALEAVHVKLLESFFAEKRREIDDFVQAVWVPTFAQEFFSDPAVDAVWQQVTQSSNPQDRLQFIVLVGPKLQQKINNKRNELVEPLDELERAMRSKLETEYDQARAINGTLTAFLQSASRVEENRKRYLEMLGVTDQDINQFIATTDSAVRQLVSFTQDAESRAKNLQQYREKLGDILGKIHN